MTHPPKKILLFILLLFIFSYKGETMKINVLKPEFDGDYLIFRVKTLDNISDSIYIAGTFNNWADNKNGVIENTNYAMEKIENNLYEKKVKIAPGSYKFKVAVGTYWMSPDGFEKDSGDNAVIHISENQKLSNKPVIIKKAHQSFYDIPFANGFSPAKFNTVKQMADSFKNHIYSNIDEKHASVEIIRSIDFSVKPKTGSLQKLSESKIESAGYKNGTGIVKVIFKIKDNKLITAYYFSSMLRTYNNIQILIENVKELDITPVIQWNNDINPKQLNETQWNTDIGNINVNFIKEKKYYLLSINHINEKTSKITPEEILEAEKKYWKEWHKKTKKIKGLTNQEEELYYQSLAILKMAQCREKGKPSGQILASLPPGMWNICWIRDAAYAMNGLIMANHFEETKKALEFFINADCGKYIKYIVDNEEVGLKIPYQISTCRYFGNGVEESDGGDDPNIELDGFGLFLWTLENYTDASNDIDFIKTNWKIISEKIADVLVANIDQKHRVIRKDSSIWERHIRNNGRENGSKKFTYTNITAIRGLLAAAKLAEKIGLSEKKIKYSNVAADLTAGFFEYQIDKKTNIIKDSVERQEIETFIDGSVVEAINFGIVSEKSDEAKNTISAFNKYIKIKNRPLGYFRNLDGTHYDKQEWVVIDLRIAASLIKMGKHTEAKKIINWVTSQSAKNFNIIAELYNEHTANYEGAVPMCGFGPGAYILAINEYYKKMD